MTIDDFESHINNSIEVSSITGTIAVALSGGSDSLALTIALSKMGHNPLAILVNHHLRKTADYEIKITTKTLQKFNIKYAVQNWDGDYKHNLEAEARKARYKLLLDICKQHNINNLCIGHHIDDQIKKEAMVGDKIVYNSKPCIVIEKKTMMGSLRLIVKYNDGSIDNVQNDWNRYKII